MDPGQLRCGAVLEMRPDRWSAHAAANGMDKFCQSAHVLHLEPKPQLGTQNNKTKLIKKYKLILLLN
jgi:hypothetical protein